MAVPSAWSVVREILSADSSLTADEVITKAKAKGVKAADDVIRTTVHNVRKKLKRKAAASASTPVPAAARKTTAPARPASPSAVSVVRTSELKTAGVKSPPAPTPKPAVATPTAVPAAVAPAHSPAAGLSAVLSNVALVNAAVAACGGVDPARQVAEAVRACGGPDAFAQYLDLVAGIRTGGAS